MQAVLALAATALGQHDAVSLLTVGDDMATVLKSVSGKGAVLRIAQQLLAEQGPAGNTALAGGADAPRLDAVAARAWWSSCRTSSTTTASTASCARWGICRIGCCWCR